MAATAEPSGRWMLMVPLGRFRFTLVMWVELASWTCTGTPRREPSHPARRYIDGLSGAPWTSTDCSSPASCSREEAMSARQRVILAHDRPVSPGRQFSPSARKHVRASSLEAESVIPETMSVMRRCAMRPTGSPEGLCGVEPTQYATIGVSGRSRGVTVSYTHLRAHET